MNNIKSVSELTVLNSLELDNQEKKSEVNFLRRKFCKTLAYLTSCLGLNLTFPSIAYGSNKFLEKLLNDQQRGQRLLKEIEYLNLRCRQEGIEEIDLEETKIQFQEQYQNSLNNLLAEWDSDIAINDRLNLLIEIESKSIRLCLMSNIPLTLETYTETGLLNFLEANPDFKIKLSSRLPQSLLNKLPPREIIPDSIISFIVNDKQRGYFINNSKLKQSSAYTKLPVRTSFTGSDPLKHRKKDLLKPLRRGDELTLDTKLKKFDPNEQITLKEERKNDEILGQHYQKSGLPFIHLAQLSPTLKKVLAESVIRTGNEVSSALRSAIKCGNKKSTHQLEAVDTVGKHWHSRKKASEQQRAFFEAKNIGQYYRIVRHGAGKHIHLDQEEVRKKISKIINKHGSKWYKEHPNAKERDARHNKKTLKSIFKGAITEREKEYLANKGFHELQPKDQIGELTAYFRSGHQVIARINMEKVLNNNPDQFISDINEIFV